MNLLLLAIVLITANNIEYQAKEPEEILKEDIEIEELFIEFEKNE